MLRIVGPGGRLCDGWTRREILTVGGLGLLGATLPKDASGAPIGRAKACIVLFLMGGPPQHSTWDPKPDAPAEVRGEFGPIATNVPGISYSSLLPNCAKVADKLCVLRAVSTGDNAHSSSGYYMITGRPHQPMNFENANPGPPNDAPSVGALVGLMAEPRGGLPGAVTLPHRIFNTDGSVWPGQDAGTLGRARDPWLLNAKPTADGLDVREIALPADLDGDRIGRRRDLLDRLAHGLDALERDRMATNLNDRQRQAFDLLRSAGARRAFRLDLEPEAIRARYGASPFGRSVLLARRLVEAGARLVQVNWYRGPDEPPDNPCWDSHVKESERLRTVLAPPADQALSALVEDLDRRGLLDETLVVCLSEFGRTPRLEGNGGRGHWGSVFSIALAGGGIQGGQVYGSSDKVGALPREGRVRPEDLTATVFNLLGISPRAEYRDPLGRPQPLSRGEVLRAIL
ncbi:MAG TPA: DUF1501 domain-containing protein [Isosphaeraceae bacterium]|jgi:hypothetical protein|nr:DUF1501 domain-containing protein [Isosphaeraceae bacterium]